VKISDSDIKAYYDTHKTQYVQPESRDVRHILVTKKALADSLYQQLKSGGTSPSSRSSTPRTPDRPRNGGKLTVSKGQTVPAFDKTAFSLKTGQISQPVHTQYGYQHHPGALRSEGVVDDVACAGARVDQAAARAAAQERQGHEVARRHEEELLQREDQVPDRLPAEPGSLRDGHGRDLHFEVA
jgi:hypothetical protein